MREYRRFQVMELLMKLDLSPVDRRTCSILAEKLGVHRSTIWRDIQWMLRKYRLGKPCPLCRCEVRHIPRDAVGEYGV